ncbi:MAG TPA: sugar ABC transporter permease [Rectinemataceae bacterium]|nr:sugar ABC transporter permease [Rectinemataceae bacterium]
MSAHDIENYGRGGGRKTRARDWKRGAFVFLCVLPAILFLAVFLYYPIEETFRISTTKSLGLGPEIYIGLENYRRLLASQEFLAGLLHVFTWAFWSVVIQLPLAFAVAFLLSYYSNRFTGPLKSIFYLANVLPSAITAMLGKFVFAPNYGMIASFAKHIGWKWLGGVDFLGDPRLAFWAVFAVATWAYTGFPIIYLMARIEQMPKELREAAELDGASPWRYARSIVLPDLGYPLRILAVLCTVGSLKLFDLPNMMTTGGPGYATETLGIMLYRRGFIDWDYGLAAAIGVVIFLLSLLMTAAELSIGARREKIA